MDWIRKTGTLAVLGGLGLAGLSGLGASRWHRLTQALHERLEAGRRPPRPARYDARELDGLPAPVGRYFRAALRDGQPVVAAATLTHAGLFNLGERTERWKPFTSSERLVTRQPGFVWDGRVSVLPGLAVHVHDAYIAGEGLLRPALLGLFRLDELSGTGAVAQGELMRFLAEAACYPTALLPSQGVRWEAVDERSARASLSDQGHTVRLTFGFGSHGLIEWVEADARGRRVAGRTVATPWGGTFSDYRCLNGMTVPFSSEVAWRLPEGRRPYWRGRLLAMEVELAA